MTEISHKYVNIVLDEAIKLIDRGWTQNTYARKRGGISVHYCSSEAREFCLLGALHKAVEVNIQDNYIRAYIFSRALTSIESVLKKRKKPVDLVRFNDNVAKTKRAVINLIKKAREIND